MKNIIILSALAVFALASCKKDYTCECSTTIGSEVIQSTSVFNGKKKDAKEACEFNNSTSPSSTIKCEIQ